MVEYIVTIEETVSEGFKISADSVKEALEIARQMYKNGELVLEPGNLVSGRMSVSGHEGDEGGVWYEL